MKLITSKDRALHAAQSWYEQYHTSRAPRYMQIHDKLSALGSNTTPEAVDAIIGNDSWTKMECYGCMCMVDEAIEIERYGRQICLCKSCLSFALSLF